MAGTVLSEIFLLQLILSPNGTSEIFVNLTVPHYVPPGIRSKVTVTATALDEDSLDLIKEEISFYFFVMGGETSRLSDLDRSPPRCSLTEDCWQESCQDLLDGQLHQFKPRSEAYNYFSADCDDYHWDSVFSVSDQLTGLFSSSILQPSEAAIIQSWLDSVNRGRDM